MWEERPPVAPARGEWDRRLAMCARRRASSERPESVRRWRETPAVRIARAGVGVWAGCSCVLTPDPQARCHGSARVVRRSCTRDRERDEKESEREELC